MESILPTADSVKQLSFPVKQEMPLQSMQDQWSKGKHWCKPTHNAMKHSNRSLKCQVAKIALYLSVQFSLNVYIESGVITGVKWREKLQLTSHM